MVLEELYNLVVGMEGSVNALITILILLVLIAIILVIAEMKFRKKIERIIEDRNLLYQEKLKDLYVSNRSSEETLELINKLARDFFKEAFNLPLNLEYSELMDKFRTAKKKECVSFCYLMIKLSYSGERIEQEEIKILIRLLWWIIKKNKIIVEEPKTKEIEQKEKETKQTRIEEGEKVKEQQIKEEKTEEPTIIKKESKLKKIFRFINEKDPIPKIEKKIEIKIKNILDRRRMAQEIISRE